MPPDTPDNLAELYGEIAKAEADRDWRLAGQLKNQLMLARRPFVDNNGHYTEENPQ